MPLFNKESEAYEGSEVDEDDEKTIEEEEEEEVDMFYQSFLYP